MEEYQMEGSYKEPPKESKEKSRNTIFQRDTWQIILLIIVAVFATLYVTGIIGGDGENGPTVTPNDTLSWPTVITNTPLPSLTPTLTPGPTSTPTPTSTLTPTSTPTPTPTSTSTPTPTPTNTPIVVITNIKTLGCLETTKYIMKTVVEVEDKPSNLIEQISGDKLLLIAEGEVVAGFDLQKVQSSDIVVQGTSVTLTLPTPQILYSRVDNEKTYVYERTTGLLRRPDPDLEAKARRLAEEQLVTWALEREILVQAKKAGKFYLKNFLRSLGLVEIVINIKP